MFTGIIETTGVIKSITPRSGDAELVIQSGHLDFSDVNLGDSIATNGICLTVTNLGSDWFSVDVSKETMAVSTLKKWQAGTIVNLEKAMLPTTRFGGHLVSGHVDGIGTVTKKRQDARSVFFEITLPKDLQRYTASKGSVTVDGISLTTNAVLENAISLNIVPHTAKITNISTSWIIGAQVNIEVDLIARYLERLINQNASAQHTNHSIDQDFLAKHGFINK